MGRGGGREYIYIYIYLFLCVCCIGGRNGMVAERVFLWQNTIKKDRIANTDSHGCTQQTLNLINRCRCKRTTVAFALHIILSPLLSGCNAVVERLLTGTVHVSEHPYAMVAITKDTLADTASGNLQAEPTSSPHPLSLPLSPCSHLPLMEYTHTHTHSCTLHSCLFTHALGFMQHAHTLGLL